MNVRTFVLSVSFWVVPGIAIAQSPPPGTCFDVTLSDWVGRQVELDSLAYSVPPRILVGESLEGDRADGGMPRRLTIPIGGLPTPHRMSRWIEYAGDSAHVFWSTGFVGVRARVRLIESGFEGNAEPFTDVIGADWGVEAAIRGFRVPCLPLNQRLEDQRPLLRALPLAAGGELAVGERLDMELTSSQHRPGVWVLGPDLAAPFGGVSKGYLSVNSDETLRRVRVWYPEPGAFEELLTILVREMGQPMYRRPSSTEWESESVGWQNRTTTVILYSAGAVRPEGAVSLSIELRTGSGLDGG